MDLQLIEKIWLEAGASSAYTQEIRQTCLAANSTLSLEKLNWLPLLFCELNGGNKQKIIPIITAWNLLRHAARLLDDIEDGDVKVRRIPEPISLNISTGILFTVGEILNSLEFLGMQAQASHDIRHKFNKELLKVCSGQHLDLRQTTPSLEECWQIAGSKSGAFLGLICWAGGRVANANPKQLDTYYQFGYNLGLLDQIKDDLADLWTDDTHYSDLRNGHFNSLAVGYAYSVLPSNDRDKLLDYLVNSSNSLEDEKEARQLIIGSGAGVYLTVQSAYYVQQNQQLITEMGFPLEAQNKLNNILEKIQLPTASI